ncbi:hypothetical protein HK102_012382, partial [Quaeritorhiza haematococci]
MLGGSLSTLKSFFNILTSSKRAAAPTPVSNSKGQKQVGGVSTIPATSAEHTQQPIAQRADLETEAALTKMSSDAKDGRVEKKNEAESAATEDNLNLPNETRHRLTWSLGTEK